MPGVFHPPLEVYSPDDFMAVLDDLDAGEVTPEERVEIEAEIARRRAQSRRAVRASRRRYYTSRTQWSGLRYPRTVW